MPIVLDIGMNLGRFTLLSAQLGGRVIAIEPQPACISSVSQELQKQPLLMQQVIILNAAVGREPGVLKKLAAKSVLLTDPSPFKMTKQEVDVPGVPGKLYSTFSMEQLVHDRLSYDGVDEPLPHGCNVWFVFTESAV
eukprot:gene5668-5905_t